MVKKILASKIVCFNQFFPQKLCICIALIDTFLSIAAHLCLLAVVRAKSYDREKAWSSIIHSVLSGWPFINDVNGTGERPVPLKKGIFNQIMKGDLFFVSSSLFKECV
jgi:hypothetical protein